MTKETECIICNNPADLVCKDFNGYSEGESFNIYYCSFCNTSFAWPHLVNNKVYEAIYSQSDIVPGYNRYALFAHEITRKRKPLQYLAQREAAYFAVREILSQIADERLKILEVGSGLGYLTYAIAREGYNIVGLDISMDAIKKAEKKFGKHYICADVSQYAYDNKEKVDIIILTEVIEHVPDPLDFCSVLLGILKPEGRLIISTPNKSAFPKEEYWNTELPPVHLSWFSEDSFKRISEQKNLLISFFDFTRFNKTHFDFTKFKYYNTYIKRHKIAPTLSREGRVLKPKTLMGGTTFERGRRILRKCIKSIVERIIIFSPLIDKKNSERSSTLCVVLQKQENNSEL